MKRISIAIACVLLTTTAVPGQTLTKTKPAGIGKSELTSDEDLNIRAYIELLRTDVKKAKTQVMSDVMQLDADEAAKFWPIYKDFEAELSALGDQIVAVIKEYTANYKNMAGTTTDQLASKVLNVEQERNALKRKYYQRFKETLDPITAMRFLQVENQLERLIDLQVAAELPVIRQPEQ